MEIYAYFPPKTNKKIQIWEKNADSCVVQEFENGNKSKKSRALIKEYNGKRYIMCKGHRYYLDRFAKYEI